MSQYDDDEPLCNIAGQCCACEEDREREISNCKFCGKQLELIDGQWWTWEVADDVRAGDRSRALPQTDEPADWR